MLRFLAIATLVCLASCGKGQGTKVYPVKAADFNKYINQKEIYDSPNLTEDKAIVNNDYPIEIALYKDNKFYYNLPNLGDGVGTWSYNHGFLKLTASRKIFDMEIEVHSLDEASNALALKFNDRFGPNTIKVTNENMD